jgi:hypothetical protein
MSGKERFRGYSWNMTFYLLTSMIHALCDNVLQCDSWNKDLRKKYSLFFLRCQRILLHYAQHLGSGVLMSNGAVTLSPVTPIVGWLSWPVTLSTSLSMALGGRLVSGTHSFLTSLGNLRRWQPGLDPFWTASCSLSPLVPASTLRGLDAETWLLQVGNWNRKETRHATRCTPYIAGGVITCTGYLASSLATSVLFLYFSFALIGVGLGFCAIVCVVILFKYTEGEGESTIALGLAASGVGTGMFIYPLFNEWVLFSLD